MIVEPERSESARQKAVVLQEAKINHAEVS